MPKIVCPHCEAEKFYANSMGIEITLPCKECGKEIKVPFKAAKQLDKETVKCKRCGKDTEIAVIYPRKYLSFVVSTLGTETTSNRTPEIRSENLCDKCFNELAEKEGKRNEKRIKKQSGKEN